MMNELQPEARERESPSFLVRLFNPPIWLWVVLFVTSGLMLLHQHYDHGRPSIEKAVEGTMFGTPSPATLTPPPCAEWHDLPAEQQALKNRLTTENSWITHLQYPDQGIEDIWVEVCKYCGKQGAVTTHYSPTIQTAKP